MNLIQILDKKQKEYQLDFGKELYQNDLWNVEWKLYDSGGLFGQGNYQWKCLSEHVHRSSEEIFWRMKGMCADRLKELVNKKKDVSSLGMHVSIPDCKS